MGQYKYFTDDESRGMSPDTCQMRDRARELFGFPIEQTRGYSTPEECAALDNLPTSAHAFGKAWDMVAPQDPFMRCKLAWALGAAGFLRVEICPRHFHADNDYSKPNPACFEGTDH